MPSQERVVLLDEAGRCIGSANKAAVHTRHTPLHSAFSIFLFNSAGEMLVQQRAWTKKTWPGIWSNACCGHPAPGEELQLAAQRRLSQELGLHGIELQLALPRFRYRAEYLGIVENEICPVFIGRCQREPRLNPAEVAHFDWVDWAAFTQAAQAADENPRFAHFSPWSLLEAKALDQCGSVLHLF
jgi:isopentenyl-diphosphate delta-isomerase